jgi:two-component system response regulator
MILLVDDSGDDLALALRALRRSNLPVDVRTARDGREALAVLDVEHRSARPLDPLRPAVIFLDLRMPRVDGFEVLRALRRAPHTRDIPVVVCSSSSSADDVRRAYALGANSYLLKCGEGEDAGALIAQAARYWVELNFLPKAG